MANDGTGRFSSSRGTMSSVPLENRLMESNCPFANRQLKSQDFAETFLPKFRSEEG